MAREKKLYAVSKHEIPSNEVMKEVFTGAVDMHMHPAPDPGVARPLNAGELALEAQRIGMRGMVMKSFFFPTQPLHDLCKMIAPDVDMFGSIVLGSNCGGLEASAVENQARIGCKVLWLPAFDSYWFRKGMGMQGGYTLLDEEGRLLPEMMEILDVAEEYGMVVCSGHIPYEEEKAVFTECHRRGMEKLVATHPFSFIPTHLTMEQAKEMMFLGAYIEFTTLESSHRLGNIPPETYVRYIHEIGAEHCIVSSDYGQTVDPDEPSGFRADVGMLMYFGVTPDEMITMIRKNPYTLLGLE